MLDRKPKVVPGGCKPHELTTELVWFDEDGVEQFFALPVSLAEMLTVRIAAEFSRTVGNSATRMSVVLYAKHKDKPFALDRRAMSGQDRENGSPRTLCPMLKAAGFTEWTARTARYVLRKVGFLEQDEQQKADESNTAMAKWRLVGKTATGKPLHKRVATIFRIGQDFRIALAFAIKRSLKAAFKPIQAVMDAVLPNITPSIGSPLVRVEESISNEAEFQTMGGLKLFGGQNLLALAMKAARQTKPGDDLSEFMPGLGPQPYESESERAEPPKPPAEPPTLRAAVMPVRPFSPLERALRDFEDCVFANQ